MNFKEQESPHPTVKTLGSMNATQETNLKPGMRSKNEELKYINALQDKYVDELVGSIESKTNSILKETNLTSPTGTGKTQMIAKLINKRPDWFFLITTLSHGQLHKQVEEVVKSLCSGDNYKIFGVSSFTKVSKLTASDILSLLPTDKKVVWLRDEGHRNTNNWSALLEDRCDKIVNISATNKEQEGVVCNFSDTMMLRTVVQREGSFQNAIDTFLDVKSSHAELSGYTPCILFRVVTKKASEEIIAELQQRGISYINLVGYDDYDMRELCQDNCSVEAIIYMQKMDVGIDIRRAHVIWLQTTPSNITTTIQCVGRCRRNALFWRDDIDILAPENHELLEKTRVCHAFYKMEGAIVDTDEYGEMVNAFCPYISIQKLRAGCFVNVESGTMQNGLKIIELDSCTGTFEVTKDPATGFNVVDNPQFYATEDAVIQNHLADPRMDALFIPSQHLRDAISNVIAKIVNDPWKYIEYGIEYGGRFDSPIRTAGLYSGEKIAAIYGRDIELFTNKYNPHYYTTKTTINQKTYKKTETFLKNCVLSIPNAEIRFSDEAWNDPSIKEFASKHAPLELGEEIKRELAYLKKACSNSFPSEISPQKYASIRKYCPLLSQFVLRSPVALQKDDIILYYKGEYYTYQECLNVVEYGTIAPHRPQTFNMTVANREIAIIGAEKYQLVERTWVPMVSVTSLISSDSKLRRFLYQRYSSVIDVAKPYLYKQKQTVNLDDRRQNSCLGYCVEYYSKALLYKDYLAEELSRIRQDVTPVYSEDAIMVRACLDKYRGMMIQTFGNGIARALRFPSLETLGKDEYQKFIETCKALGTQTKASVQEILDCPVEIEHEYSTSLSTRHLRGLMDIVSYDTIIDIKVTGEISEKMILQVLAYYYLSQYRSDLAIDRVVVYDAVYDRYLAISGLRTGNVQIAANYKPSSKLDQVEVVPAKSAPTLNYTHPAQPRNKASDRPKTSYVGRQAKMNCGLIATVIEDFGCNDITIQFEDGVIRKHCRRDKFREGKIGHPGEFMQ